MNKYVIIRSMLSYIMASLILRHQRVLTPCLASYKQTVVNAIALIWDLRGPAQHKKSQILRKSTVLIRILQLAECNSSNVLFTAADV